MRARAHDIIEIDACPVLAPGMNNALSAARALATVLAPLGKPLDIAVTATMAGLDVDMRGSGPLDFPQIQALIAVAGRLDLARLANHGDIVIERRLPTLAMGRARVVPPPGTFLQATQAGEETLARLVHAGIGKARRTADLFAGVGTFALRLAETTEVHGVESDAVALAALDRAAREASGLHPITVERRDLVRRPLAFGELAPFEAVVFDPPRVGAQAQAKALAASKVPRVVAVSCNAESFARDAAILTAGGYACEGVTPIDQFRHSPHVEMVGVFARPTQKGRKRGLLG
jgi:23S rRNA (uracil1939-C5)-methyltransferase